MDEVSDARDLTFKIKTNDAVVVGIFESKGSAGEKLYRSVAGDMGESGILFAVCYDAKVAKKYLDDGPPSVAVFKNFDPETGHSKKHVKGKGFTSELGDYGALYKFIFAEALPLITRIPFNNGPDASRRKQLAMSGGGPKLFRFTSASNDLKDPEDKGEDGSFLRGVAKLKGKATVVAVTVEGGEHDEGLSYLENMGFDEEELPKLIMVSGGEKDAYTGKLDDDVAIAGWAERFAEAHASDWSPTGSGKKPKKEKKSKKKSKKEL